MTRRARVVPLLAALLLALSSVTPARADTVRLDSALRGDTVATAVAWSETKFPDGNVLSVILGRSDSFADSLAAGSLAVLTEAPLLLNPPGDDLDDAVADELDRLAPSLVRIIGGTAAVSIAVEHELEDRGYEVERHAGANRVETAVRVASDVQFLDVGLYDESDEAFLARGFGVGSAAWADSLAGGVVAGTRRGPLLVSTTDTLSAEVRAYLADRPGLDTIFVLGGTAAISDAVVQQLQAMGRTVERLAGENRFGTAVAASEMAFADDTSGRITLVDGLTETSWASGFAGGFAGGALLLSNGEDVPHESQDALHAFGERQDAEHWLYCAPEVAEKACDDADKLVNGGFVVGIG